MTGQLIPMPVDDPLVMAFLDCNDLGNAQRLERLAKGELLWVDELGWTGYDRTRWSVRDGERMAIRLAHEVARHIDREAMALAAIAGDDAALERAFGRPIPVEFAKDRVVNLRKWATKSGDASRTAAMLVQARALLSARLEDFDRDPLALNVENGTLRFVQGKAGGWEAQLDAHDPVDRIMHKATVSYDPDAKCPKWQERLELLQPDADQRTFLQQRYGYFLTGLISEQKWFIDQGRGGDGKSMTNAVVSGLMGDYFEHADIKSFLQGAAKSGSDHSSDMARLRGDIRFVLVEEPPTNATWDGSRLKQITGGKITCRAMREKEFTYEARWKLLIEVNPLPKVPNDDDGFWRRVQLAPWSHQFDPRTAEAWDIVLSRLMSEASGVLNWMIEGTCAWLATRSLPASKRGSQALLSYRQSASTFAEWLTDRTDSSDPGARTPAKVLYDDFKAYAEAAGVEKPMSQTAFGTKLRDRQNYVYKDPKGNRWRIGIKLREDGVGALDDAAAASPPSGVGGSGAAPDQGAAGRYFDDGDDRP